MRFLEPETSENPAQSPNARATLDFRAGRKNAESGKYDRFFTGPTTGETERMAMGEDSMRDESMETKRRTRSVCETIGRERPRMNGVHPLYGGNIDG